MLTIILGAGINEKGVLSGETIKRLLEGYKVYKEKRVPLLLSGKYNFLYKKKPTFTEAGKMKEYLLNLGVQEEDVFLDTESEDTIFSAYNAKTKFALPKNEKEVVIVTSDINLNRIEYVFFKVFGEEYNLHFIGTTSKLPCAVKGMVLEKQRLLNEKAKLMLDDIEEGDHEKIKERALVSERGVVLPKDIKYRKTC
jgi:vancomycin permeability regulator SanA